MSDASCPGRGAFRTGEDYRDHLPCEDCEPTMNHAENKQHPWQPGELCTCTYGNVGKGIVYRVTKVDNTVTKWGLSCTLDLIPVHGVLADVGAHRPRRSMGAGYCTPLSLIELATEYAKLGNFIRDEAMKKGEDGAA